MNCLDAALRFNRCCPKGSAVEVVLRSGERLSTKTTGAAFVWGGLALVELEGRQGPYQVEHVRPIANDAPPSAENYSEPERQSA
jgi:hypothetical protein